jgi:hypothetical protein
VETSTENSAVHVTACAWRRVRHPAGACGEPSGGRSCIQSQRCGATAA